MLDHHHRANFVFHLVQIRNGYTSSHNGISENFLFFCEDFIFSKKSSVRSLINYRIFKYVYDSALVKVLKGGRLQTRSSILSVLFSYVQNRMESCLKETGSN